MEVDEDSDTRVPSVESDLEISRNQDRSSAASTSKAEPSPILVNLPNGCSLHNSLRQWATIQLDGIQMPAIIRRDRAYVPVRWVEAKLLAPFPIHLNLDLREYTMLAHRLSAGEAWVLNTVHGVLSHFSLGFSLLTENDHVVAHEDVARFYWNVKAASLSTAAESVESTLSQCGNNVTLMATLSQLKQVIDLDYKKAKMAVAELAGSNRGSLNGHDEIDESNHPKIRSMTVTDNGNSEIDSQSD